MIFNEAIKGKITEKVKERKEKWIRRYNSNIWRTKSTKRWRNFHRSKPRCGIWKCNTRFKKCCDRERSSNKSE